MPKLEEIASRIEVITFDCYGTLVDWDGGIREGLAYIVEAAGATNRVDPDEMLAEYRRIEPVLQQEDYMSYASVLNTAVVRLAERFGFDVPPSCRTALSDTLDSWPVFADTNQALRRLAERYRLGVLSNIDRSLFAWTARNLEPDFHLVVTAEDVGSYKPAAKHFLRALELMKGNWAGWLHVAQSLYHDCVPCGELGIPCVWINRSGEENATTATPIAEFPTLAAFADRLLES